MLFITSTLTATKNYWKIVASRVCLEILINTKLFKDIAAVFLST